MQVLSNARRLARVLKPPVLLGSAATHKLLSSDIQITFSPRTSHQWESYNFYSSDSLYFSGTRLLMAQQEIYSRAAKASFSTEASSAESTPTESVKELYDKILESVNVKRTMAPNAWLWSLIENCKNNEDVRLLFDSLHNLRKFRLSNLRIHENFNCHLCREVTKACAKVGAIDFGKKALWKHNVYGLTPNIGSANHLLSYAKEHNDVSFMVEVMQLLKKNHIPLQPSTADIVFSICYNAGNWELISKYLKKFLKAGVKLRKTAFDILMDFAIKRGDTESLWQIEKLRSESTQQHTLVSGFSCAKGLILERKIEDAAAVIQILNESSTNSQVFLIKPIKEILPWLADILNVVKFSQHLGSIRTLSDTKKSGIVVQLQKLVSEWPLDVVKQQPEENRKAVAAALKTDIPAVVGLLNMGLELNVNLEDLTSKAEIPS